MAEDEAFSLIEVAAEVQKKEEKVLTQMEEGASLFDMLSFEEHYQKIRDNRRSQLRFSVE